MTVKYYLLQSAFSKKLFCSKFKRNLFANNRHKKKSALVFVIQNGLFRHPRVITGDESWDAERLAPRRCEPFVILKGKFYEDLGDGSCSCSSR